MESLQNDIGAPDGPGSNESSPGCTGAALSEDRVTKLQMEVKSYMKDFYKENKLQYVREAVAKGEEALHFACEDHPERLNILDQLSVALERLSGLTGSLDDLRKAIITCEEARDIAMRRNQDASHILSNMAMFNCQLFEHTGDTNLLQKAANLFEAMLENLPEESTTSAPSDRGVYLTNLGGIYGTRYQWTYAMEDIQQSILNYRNALDFPTDNNFLTTTRRIQLGNALASGYSRSRDLKDIGEAIDQAEKALMSLDSEDASYLRPFVLGHLGNWLAKKYEKTRSSEDIDRAIKTTQEAIRCTPSPRDNHLAVHWNDLGGSFAAKYQHSKTPENESLDVLQEAINSFKKSIEESIQDKAPEQGTRYLNLGTALDIKYKRSKDESDFNSALEAFEMCWNLRNAQPLLRIKGASKAAELLITDGQWLKASNLLDGAVSLLPIIAPRALRHKDQQYTLGQFANLATTAACVALKAGKIPSHALRLLELGRGVIANLLFGLRVNDTIMSDNDPELAEFERLRDTLDTPSEASVSMTSRYEANEKLEKLLKEPKLKDLLHLSDEKMRQTAKLGPVVVINVSEHGCDAIIVQKESIRVVHLDDLHESDISQYSKDRESTRTLDWLWKFAVRPVLDVLGLKTPVSDGKWPRIWWIPTGKLSLFPLHAAGDYSRDYFRAPSLSVLDVAISSYSLSIQSLIYSRQLRDKDSLAKPPATALLVSMSETYRFPPLTYARDEIRALEKDISIPKVTLQEPTREKVLEQLRTCSIFHFAGHGELDPVDPSESRLLLKDWSSKPLTVAHLMELKLVSHPPLLAYLSACSTGQNHAEQLMDESIHLMSACQLAGFQHVVGSLWKVGDEYSMREAIEVYKAVDNEKNDIALGVHNAAIHFRNESHSGGRNDSAGSGDLGDRGVAPAVREDKLAPWAAYIHIGP